MIFYKNKFNPRFFHKFEMPPSPLYSLCPSGTETPKAVAYKLKIMSCISNHFFIPNNPQKFQKCFLINQEHLSQPTIHYTSKYAYEEEFFFLRF